MCFFENDGEGEAGPLLFFSVCLLVGIVWIVLCPLLLYPLDGFSTTRKSLWGDYTGWISCAMVSYVYVTLFVVSIKTFVPLDQC